ncbi:MAG: hypothetical protein ACHQ50_08560 [Fimbriimonadales bacterium]
MSTKEEPANSIPAETEARIRELQALITDSQRRADKAEDEDIREALNLQVSKLGLKVARLKRGQPEGLPSEVVAAVEEEEEPLPKPTPQQLEDADKLLQRARLEKSRGNSQAASDLLKQAADAAPGAAPVVEAVGDDLVERKHYAAAREAYKAAHRADPKNPSIERKLAQLSMTGLADMSIEDQLRMGSLDSPFIQQGEALANPKMAVVLSVIIPGLGQFVMGQTKKGALLFFGCLVSSILFALLATLLHTGTEKSLPTIAYFPLAIAIACWIGGVADASSTAKSAEKRTVSKPPPPVNLPFE